MKTLRRLYRIIALCLGVLAAAVPSSGVSAGVNFWTQYYGDTSDTVIGIEMLPGYPGIQWLAGGGLMTNISGGWVDLTPTFPPAFCVEVDPTDPNIIYFGTMSPISFLKSVDGGANWDMLNSGLPTYGEVKSLAMDPAAPTTLYAGTEDGTYKTTDGGAVWNAAYTGMGSWITVYDIEIDPSDTAVLFAATSNGVYRSTDGALSWTQVGSGVVEFPLALAVNPLTPDTLYVGTRAGAFISQDGETSWYPTGSALDPYTVTALAIDPLTPSTMYAGTEYGGVFKSRDGGSTWASLNYSMDFSGLIIRSLALDPSIPADVFVGITNYGEIILEQTPDSFGKGAPAGGVYVPLDTTLTWDISSGASIYEYCVDTANNDACDTGWINTGLGRSVNRTFASGTTYYWQVRAVNPNGTEYANEGNWRSFATPTFADVGVGHWALSFIERLYAAGITGGCASAPLQFCPNGPVTRAQMAVFLERGMRGSSYTPPPASGTVFSDVPVSYWAAAWIEQLAADGITGGCGGGNYCPNSSVTRAEMAIFLLRGEHGASYTPPAATGLLFADVPISYWAAAWIEQLAAEGITGGCGGGNYCPNQSVTRAEMAVFLVRAFSLP